MMHSPFAEKSNSASSNKEKSTTHYLCKNSGSNNSSSSLHFNSVSNSLGLSTSKEESPIPSKIMEASHVQVNLGKANWYSSSTNASGGGADASGINQPLSMTFCGAKAIVSEFDLRIEMENHDLQIKEEENERESHEQEAEEERDFFASPESFKSKSQNKHRKEFPHEREELNSSMKTSKNEEKLMIIGDFLTPKDSEDDFLDRRLREIQWKKQILEEHDLPGSQRKTIEEDFQFKPVSMEKKETGVNSGLSKIFEQLVAGMIDLHLGILDSLTLEEVKELPESLPKTEKDFDEMNGDSLGLLCSLGNLMIHVCRMRAEVKKSLEEMDQECKNCLNYESLIQKLEGDVRLHIGIEQQLKLHMESTQQKLEEFEKEEEVHESVKAELENIKEENMKLKETEKKMKEELLREKEESLVVKEEKKAADAERKSLQDDIKELQRQISQLKSEMAFLKKPQPIQENTQIYQNTFDIPNKENFLTLQATPSFNEPNPAKKIIERARLAQKPECPASGSTLQCQPGSIFQTKVLNYFTQKEEPSTNMTASMCSKLNGSTNPSLSHLYTKASSSMAQKPKSIGFLKPKDSGTRVQKATSKVAEKKHSNAAIGESVSNYYSGPSHERIQGARASKSREKLGQNFNTQKSGSQTQRTRNPSLLESEKPFQDDDCLLKKGTLVSNVISKSHLRNQSSSNLNKIVSYRQVTHIFSSYLEGFQVCTSWLGTE